MRGATREPDEAGPAERNRVADAPGPADDSARKAAAETVARRRSRARSIREGKWLLVFLLVCLAGVLAVVIIYPPGRSVRADSPFFLEVGTTAPVAAIEVDLAPQPASNDSTLTVSVEFSPADAKNGVQVEMEIDSPYKLVTTSDCRPACSTADKLFYRALTGTASTELADVDADEVVSGQPATVEFQLDVTTESVMVDANPARVAIGLPPVELFDHLGIGADRIVTHTPIQYTVPIGNAQTYDWSSSAIDVAGIEQVPSASFEANAYLDTLPQVINVQGENEAVLRSDDQSFFWSGILLGASAAAIIAFVQEIIRLSEKNARSADE